MRKRTLAIGATAQQANPFLLSFAKWSLGVPKGADGSLACATCHCEHQGRAADLRVMGNSRCQACHVQQFDSLDQGHPEFRGYPYHQRTAIYFDHVSHIGRHFKDFRPSMPHGHAPQACTDCHVAEPSGRMMIVKGFDQICASCHLPQIMDTTLGGVAFLNLPGLDIATLREHEQRSGWVDTMAAANAIPVPAPILPVLATLFRDERIVMQPPFLVGEWPAAAAGDPSPFMQLLVSSDRNGAAAVEALRGVNLSDLRMASLGQIRAAELLLWRVKELFYDTIQEGDAALTRRLERLAEQSLTAEQKSLLMADLPPTVVWEAQKRWLPSLLTEVPNYRARQPLTRVASALPKQPSALRGGKEGGAVSDGRGASHIEQPEAVRWRIHDSDCSIQYHPRRHTDLFLRSWLDTSGDQTGPARLAFAAVFDILSSPISPGRCAKCHGVETLSNHRLRVHWLSAHPAANKHPFTTFSHQPHFSLLGGRQCELCHKLNVDGDYRASFRNEDFSQNIDPSRFVSNFVSMKKDHCTACHVAGKASNSCLLCHNYHVGTFSPFPVPPDFFPTSGERRSGN
jgi:hypothetical protein